MYRATSKDHHSIRHDGPQMRQLRFIDSVVVMVLASLMWSVGCSNREFTRTPRTGTEQLLLSHALEKSMTSLDLPSALPGKVAVDVIGFVGERQTLQPTFLPNSPMINNNTTSTIGSGGAEANFPTLRPGGSDLGMMRAVMEGHLAEWGYTPVERREDAELWIRVLVWSLGTDQGQSFFGMPPIQSTIIPFSTPALTVYEVQRQMAYVRYSLQIYDGRTGRWRIPMQWYDGSAYFKQYTLLFFFTFQRSDMVEAPTLP